MPREAKLSPSKILQSKISFGVILVIFIFSSVSLVNEIGRRKKIQSEILRQQGEIERLNRENKDLSTLIGYLRSGDFVESEARNKLNLSKPGESLIVVDPNLAEQKDLSDDSNLTSKWWDYLFK